MKPSGALALSACLFAACTSYGPQSLPPGTSIDTATRAMGAPSGDYRLADGDRRLEFRRGPWGRHTYMLDFDTAGQLRRWEQVLTEVRFSQIQPGMTSEQVLTLIGHPSELRPIGLQNETAWAYRYESPFCQWFQVGIGNRDGKVTNTAYGLDPACDVAESRLGGIGLMRP